MSWVNNLISYVDSADVGCCPCCGCKDVDVLPHTNGNRTSITFGCRNCKASAHFDGVATTKK